jgi:hypothetical protein
MHIPNQRHAVMQNAAALLPLLLGVAQNSGSELIKNLYHIVSFNVDRW